MRKRFKETEIINLLRAIEVKIAEGMAVPDACRSLGVSDKSYYRWRKLYGSMGSTEVKRCKDFEKENHRLKKIVADLELDKHILKEALDFLGHKA
jgi:putative transposase